VGGDIRDMVSIPHGLTLPAYIRKSNAVLHGSFARLQRLRAPSIAVVQGNAAGGGVSLLASCDIVVAAKADLEGRGPEWLGEVLKTRRDLLASRQQTAQLQTDNAVGYYRILDWARVENLNRFQKLESGVLFGTGASIFAVFLTMLLILVTPRAGLGRSRSFARCAPLQISP
jgi:hypothetical protein